MDLFSKYKWLLVIVGMIFVCVVISLIFLLINKCISSAGKHRISQLPKGSDFSVQSNKYQETNKYQERNLKADIPPLPPRTQFLTAEAQSYENLAEVPDDEQSSGDYEQDKADYEQDKADYEQSTGDYEQCTGDYEQCTGDYEESTPDYVKVEEEERILPPPPQYQDPDPAEDNCSMEDYDDIGGEDEIEGEEDYDDVG